jgi:hypothetical protein
MLAMPYRDPDQGLVECITCKKLVPRHDADITPLGNQCRRCAQFAALLGDLIVAAMNLGANPADEDGSKALEALRMTVINAYGKARGAASASLART